MRERDVRDPWLAVDAVTAPAVRARELQRNWDRFVGGGDANGVRAPIAESWQRSRDAGVDPAGSRAAPTSADRDDALERWATHPLRAAAPLIDDFLASIADASEHLVVVGDEAGILLEVQGDARVRSRAADSMNFTEGAQWSERDTGTNAVGTAIAADHAVQILAAEHFIEVAQVWTCSAAPVHDPETGELLGVVDLTGFEKDVHAHSLALAVTAARVVEDQLRYRLQARDDHLRLRYQRQLTGGADRRALVAHHGRLIADDPRGWLSGRRVELPPGGGELVLPSGQRAFAEPVEQGETFIVRELGGRRTRRRNRRDELRRLSDERAALHRLATVVSRDVSPTDIFAGIAREIGLLVGADDIVVARRETSGATLVGGAGRWLAEFGVGARLVLNGSLGIERAFRTGRTIRLDEQDPGAVGKAHDRSTVVTPIVIAGAIWGAIVASTTRSRLPADAEARMTDFAELVAVVIANAENQGELTAVRAAAASAGDDARRRIQRDLHDGAQQRLVSTVIALKLALRELDGATGPAIELLNEALEHANRASSELREVAHGILPNPLRRGGLRAGIDALVAQIRLPVSVEVTAVRLPPNIEATAYFILAEALTNAVRHARASRAQITADFDGRLLRLEVRDDGTGGARTDRGTGLLGLKDRAAALDGELHVHSPPGEGTRITATLPVAGT